MVSAGAEPHAIRGVILISWGVRVNQPQQRTKYQLIQG